MLHFVNWSQLWSSVEHAVTVTGFALQQARRLVFAGITRHHRHAGGGHQVLGAGLAAHLAHGGAGWADEGDSRG